jgi:replicative DNA helicase
VPPSDLDAEGAILCAVILEPGSLDRCRTVGLEAIHFYADCNRRIYESILNLDEGHEAIDLVAVASDLRLHKRLDQVGGTPYLAQLCDAPVVGPGLEQHCRTVITAWRARQAISFTQVTMARLYEPQGIPYQELIEQHEQQIWELAHEHRESTYEPAGQIAGRALTELAEALRNGTGLGVTTGFDDLDKKTGGYSEGHLVVIAARTGMGKSALGTSSIRRATRVPKDGSLPVAAYLHTLEMPKEECALRLVCEEAGVEFQKMRQNQLTRGDWEKLFAAARILEGQPILIGDKPGLTVAEFRSNIRKIKREIEIGRIQAKNLGIAAVDYLQLMTGDKSGTRELEVSSLSRNLKATAKSERVCVIALAQVNRDPEKKVGDRRPGLSTLRESGAIENDADAIWFIYREKYYNKEANDEAEVIIAKQRGGETGTVMLAFDGPTISFRPLARGYEEFHDFGDDPQAGEHWQPDN